MTFINDNQVKKVWGELFVYVLGFFATGNGLRITLDSYSLPVSALAATKEINYAVKQIGA